MLENIRHFLIRAGGERNKQIRKLEAKKTTRESGGKDFKEKDKSLLADLQREERRHVLKVIGALLAGSTVIGTLGIGGTKALYDVLQPERIPPSQLTPEEISLSQQESLEELDRFIARFETGFLAYESRVRPLVSQIEDPRMRNHILNPFDLVRLNQQNQHRNDIRFRMEEVRNVRSDVRYFSYNYHTTADTLGSFRPLDRVLFLRQDFDPDSLGHILVAHHELIHALQHIFLRSQIRTPQENEAYLSTIQGRLGESPRFRIDTEGSAFMIEIELLNLLLHNRFFESFRTGPLLTPDEIVRLFNDPKGFNHYTMLLHFAGAYFPSRNVQALYRSVQETYESYGYEMYWPDHPEDSF